MNSAGVTVKRLTRELPVVLSEDEVRLRGIELGNQVKANLDLETEKKETNKQFAERKKNIDFKIGRLKDAVREGVEMRDTEVEVRIDRYLGSTTIVRLDTGQTIEHRPCYPNELQSEMDLEDDAGGGKNLPSEAAQSPVETPA